MSCEPCDRDCGAGLCGCGGNGCEGCRDLADETAAEWFAQRKDRIGTHSPDCWKHHPDCAYWQGRRDAEDCPPTEPKETP